MFELKCLKCGELKTYTQGDVNEYGDKEVNTSGDKIDVVLYNGASGYRVECKNCNNEIEEEW
ncbi:hypothetical protein [Priestia megaterium]|uniref:hypothetical protein n=1 Tax=Priestia megaterium TaxID=1404 RepID=UPI003CC590FF